MNADELIDNTIANLKIISMVSKNGKLSVRKGQLMLDTDDNYQTIRRWINRDSRELTLLHVKNTINNAIRISKGIANNEFEIDPALRLWTIQKLVTEMKNCSNGLVNLKTTYIDDSVMVANIDVIKDRLEANCAQISEALKGDTPFDPRCEE